MGISLASDKNLESYSFYFIKKNYAYFFTCVENFNYPKWEVGSRLHFWYSYTVHYLSWERWKKSEIVRVPTWMAIISSVGKTLTAWTGSHDVDVASEVRSHGGGTAAHRNTETAASQTPPLGVFRVRLSQRAFIYSFSRHLLRVKQHSPPTQTVEKSPQPSNERRQAFPPGTDVAPSVVGWQRQRQGLECEVSVEHSGTGTAFSSFSPCFFVLYLQRRKKKKNIESVFILFNQLWRWT